jgi:hypothetical protein
LAKLKQEWRRWVARCQQLDPTAPGIPGEYHAYVNKKELSAKVRALSPLLKKKKTK